MIKFFRHIRQKLLTENKFSKYLLYAIGEIVLVVIGILIALSINNWNENQQDRELGTNYLRRIISDLETDKTILSQKIDLADKLISKYRDFIRKIYETQENKEDYIQILSLLDLNVDELILTDIAYSEMVNTGKLDLLGNVALKEKITNYYRYYEFVASRAKELNTTSIQLLTEASSKAPGLKYYFAHAFHGLGPQDLSSEDDYMYNDSDWAYINAPTSLEFRLWEETAYHYNLKQHILKPMFNELLEQTNAILEDIEKEIK